MWVFRQPHAVVLSVTYLLLWVLRVFWWLRLLAPVRCFCGADIGVVVCFVVAVFVVSLHGCEGGWVGFPLIMTKMVWFVSSWPVGVFVVVYACVHDVGRVGWLVGVFLGYTSLRFCGCIRGF